MSWGVEPLLEKDPPPATVEEAVLSPTKMTLLLLYLGLTLVCAQEEENNAVTSNFDLSKISGEWYSVLLASDCREKIEEDGSMRVFVEHIDYLGDSSLTFKLREIENGTCTEINLACKPTEKNAICRADYKGHNVVDILETDYDNYIFFYNKNFKNGETFLLLELYARTPDVSSQLKGRFVKYCEEHGIVKENIFDLTKVDRCLQARDGGAA
ncbi:PREDICTED: allergen Fel d 4-like isoform X1 [Cercocebus atys]|uniref:allergen Fel d 4-like isoform X1 n=1 Tax=Cercocebus atys TaxID=9531 RepID=UPI0005F37F12|nr:PREDICTED: allergen Fel d 4-like isoform X1 [Cercocebus atys]XP_011948231.1 PREDICTED: allergen Fel d 4-like isoform X1 [Cercocebus atys]XP_011948239.1 PREDICTED: allergen Fel d 4-like isoform X1 [Cercocebus atys]